MTGSGDAGTTPSGEPTQKADLKARLNLLSPDNTLHPSDLYKALREEAPVHWAEEAQAWLITRYEDVTNGFRDPRLSANRTALFQYQMQSLGPEAGSQEFLDSIRLMMMNRDGAEHISIRRQASPAFSPQSIDVYLPLIRRAMGMLVKKLKPQGSMDLVKEISFQLPVLVITEVLGLPVEHRQRFLEWSKPLADLFSPTPGMDMVALAHASLKASAELRAYLGDVINERRQNPGQDTISHIVHAGKMTHAELVANIFTLITAGHNTITDQLSNGVHDLLEHPDQFQLLHDNRNLVTSAVAEMLRFNSSVPFMSRIAAENFQMHGKSIQKGQIVLLGIAAANRDPSVFPEPEKFDVTRNSLQQKHHSFAFGPHHCLGAGLARRELEIAIEVLVDELPGLRLDETRPPIRKNQGFMFRGFDSLHVVW